jgi:hypothetical protein
LGVKVGGRGVQVSVGSGVIAVGVLREVVGSTVGGINVIAMLCVAVGIGVGGVTGDPKKR